MPWSEGAEFRGDPPTELEHDDPAIPPIKEGYPSGRRSSRPSAPDLEGLTLRRAGTSGGCSPPWEDHHVTGTTADSVVPVTEQTVTPSSSIRLPAPEAVGIVAPPFFRRDHSLWLGVGLMGARQKLDVASFYGCLFIASIVGLLAHSWLAFGVALSLCAAAAYDAGDIRSSRHER